jgi:iron complex outermembrane receptor protein
MAFGVNTMLNNTDNGSFFIWANPVTGAHTPYPGSEATSDSRRFMIDPFFHYFEKDGDSHRILSRYLDISNDNNMDQSNASKMVYLEYQYQAKLDNIDANLTSGIIYANTNSEAELFGDTTFNNKNIAAYIQFDKSWDKLTFSLGGRYEYNRQKSPENFQGQTIENGISEDGKPIFRVGANYKLHEYSSLRLNWGQGYRFPTITERFITTQFSGFRIFPNINLQPEFGWSSEIGLKQGISILGFKGFLDVAGFWSEYEDMMEFTLVNFGDLGFQSQNIGDTRITGLEVSVFGRANIGPIPINIYGGYTYMNPRYKTFTEEIQNASSSDENILKYRTRNNYKMDIEAFYKDLNVGVSIQGSSHMVAIDAALRLLPGAGIEDYRTVFNDGYKVFDARFGYTMDAFKISFLMNNILNKEYTVRPALLEAPRNLSFRLDYTI